MILDHQHQRDARIHLAIVQSPQMTFYRRHQTLKRICWHRDKKVQREHEIFL